MAKTSDYLALDLGAESGRGVLGRFDGETLTPVADGEVGIAKILDLMNVDSAVAVLTQDRVRRVRGGFELLGRAPGATPRGCSIAIDELVGRS